MPDTYLITYTGDGTQFISGVPPCSMTRWEWEKLPEAVQQHCLDSGLYKLAEVKTKVEPQPEGDSEE